MTPLREWLKPPKSLLPILFLLTLVSVSALGWFGFKLLEQDRMVQAQRRQERLEQAADRIAATLRGTLAETGERLSAWLAVPPSAPKPEEGILLIGDASTVTAYPPGRLLYYPGPASDPEAPAAGFAEGESLEFLQAQPARAAEVYRQIAGSGDPATRAGAFMRLARVLGKLGRREESAAVYERMAAMSGVQVAGAPADLVARHALAETLVRGNLVGGNPVGGNSGRDNLLRDDLLRGALAADARATGVLFRRSAAG